MNLNRSLSDGLKPAFLKKLPDYRRLMSRAVLVLLCLLLSQQSLTQSRAQNNPDFEAANNPSNVQSVPSAFQPTGSLYATFFYPWYKNPTVDGAWGNWEGNGHRPPTNWFSNFLPIPPGAYNASSGAINPTIGLYSSRDKGVFYWQLNQMASAKIEVAISSWWGQAVSPTNDSPGIYAVQGRTDGSFRQIVTNWMNQADNPYPNMRWTLYYEKESTSNPSVTEIVSDLKYINANYANQPSYLKINGRPVLFVYADGSDGCSMVSRWLQARAASGVNFYLVLKLFSGYTSCSSQPDSWHQYAPAVRTATHAPYSAFISPGFWKDGNSPLLARSTTDFENAAIAMVAATTQWKLVETWNEWGEGTSVEPGIQVQQTKSGAATVALNGAPFQSQYIQIMARRFPALPAGTGAGAQATAAPSPTPISATNIPSPTPRPATATPTATQTTSVTAATTQGSSVFLILMENHNWNQIKGSASAPYINALLSQGAHAEAYYNPPGMHPSEPNYLWLEAGTNFGIRDDNPPSTNHQSSTAHLTTQLNSAGISWKSYQEDISGTVCPLSGTGKYAPRHNPMVFFNDVTGTNSSSSPYCIAHVRPYTELATDIAAGNVPRYSFITPNLCNDMHDSSGCATSDSVKNGDNWLSKAIPAIQASNAYKNGGTIIITWDEGEGSDGPIGLIVLSPNAKRGYSNTLRYTHSSTLRTLQTLLGVRPWLGDAANATDLSDLFTSSAASPAAPTATLNPTNVPASATPTLTNISSTATSALTFTPVADSAVNSSAPSNNYGISATVRTDASPVVRTYMRFDVQGVSGSVASAKLRIYANSSSSRQYDVRPVSDTTWGERTITYSNAPSFGNVVSSSIASFSSNTWTEVDVTSLVQANELISLALTSNNPTAVSFGSRELSHHPQLIIQTGTSMVAAALQPFAAVAAVSSPTPTDMITLMPTDTVTSTTTAASTEIVSATLPSTSTGELVSAAPLAPANFNIVESDSPMVAGVSAWRQMSQPSGTSGGTYLLNIDPAATLTLHFNGQAVGVGFVTGPSFGQFTIEVDGVAKQVINANSNDYSIGQVVVDNLTAGEHDVRVVPSAGVVAIDSFLVTTAPAVEVVELPTSEATTANTEIVIAPTEFVPTVEATQPSSTAQTDETISLPTALPFPTLDILTEEVQAEEVQVPTEVIPATDETVSLPTALPFPTVNIPTADASQMTLISPTQVSVLPVSTLPVAASMDDGAPDWQAVGSWTLVPEAAVGSAGLGWQAAGGNNNSLHWNRQIDMRGLVGAQLFFQMQLSNASAPLMVQVSLDGSTWTTVETVTATAEWQLNAIDLSAYAGQTIQLQFVWVGNAPGDVLRLDDIQVRAAPQGAPTLPTASDASPSSERPTLSVAATPEAATPPTEQSPADDADAAATAEATQAS